MTAPALSTTDVQRAVASADRRRYRAIARGDDPTRVHTVYDDADLAPIALAGLLEDRVDHQPWRTAAACVGIPPEVFFPERGDNDAVDTARAICQGCPVAGPCLDAHLGERTGIYGNTTPNDRKRIRRENARARSQA